MFCWFSLITLFGQKNLDLEFFQDTKVKKKLQGKSKQIYSDDDQQPANF